jgi:hypothetical protein
MCAVTRACEMRRASANLHETHLHNTALGAACRGKGREFLISRLVLTNPPEDPERVPIGFCYRLSGFRKDRRSQKRSHELKAPELELY